MQGENENDHRNLNHLVSDDVFRQVYDAPASLSGCHKWLTREAAVRQIEKLLGRVDGHSYEFG